MLRTAVRRAKLPEADRGVEVEGLARLEKESVGDSIQRVNQLALADFGGFGTARGARLETAAGCDGAAVARAHLALFDSGVAPESPWLRAVLLRCHLRLLGPAGLPRLGRALEGRRWPVP